MTSILDFSLQTKIGRPNYLVLKTLSQEGREIVSLEEAKSYLRVCGSNDDALIATLVKTAMSTAEAYLSFTIDSKLFSVVYSGNLGRAIQLPHSNVYFVEKISTGSCSADMQKIGEDAFSFSQSAQVLCFRNAIFSQQTEILYRTEGIDDLHEHYFPLKDALLSNVNILYKKRGLGIDRRHISHLYSRFSKLLG